MSHTTRPARLALAALAAATFLAACGSTRDNAAPAAKTTIASTTASGLEVTLLGDGAFSTGRNAVYVRVTQGGAPVTDATVTVMPMMTMTGGMQHSCPMVGAPALGADGLYEVDAIFQMASGMMGSWAIEVGVTRPGAAQVMASFPGVPVADSGRAKTFTYTDPNTSTVTKHVASLSFVSAPKVGLNPVEVTLHRMDGMMTFSPVTDATVALDPQMPSMGHGSPGSVNPVHVEEGRYEGQLSFSMSGTWETTITFHASAAVLGAPVFTTTF